MPRSGILAQHRGIGRASRWRAPRFARLASKWGQILVPITGGTGRNFLVVVPSGRKPKLGPILVPSDPALLCLTLAVQGFCPASPIGYLGNALAERIGA